MIEAKITWACGHTGASRIDQTEHTSEQQQISALFRARDGAKHLNCWLCSSQMMDARTTVEWPMGAPRA